MKSVNLKISGMHCAACTGRVERKLKKLPGVESAAASLATHSVYIQYDPEKSNLNDFIKSIEDMGFKYVKSDKAEQADLAKEALAFKRRFTVALLFGVPVFIFAMFLPNLNTTLFQFIASSVVFFYSGYPFYSVAVPNLKNRVFDMNTLIFIGTLSAYIFSSCLVFMPETLAKYGVTHPYFDSVTVIITVVLFGRMLEANAKKNVAESITKLFSLTPQKAFLITSEGEKEVDISEVKSGDTVRLRPGESVPVDGVIIKGVVAMDESALTGESKPVDKEAEDKVYAGTHVLSGSADFEVTSIGSDTVLAAFIRQVEEAVYSKAPIQRIADKIASVFVPTVLGIAVLTFIVWYIFGSEPKLPMAIISFVTVLIIACPCSLGLATPSAIMAAVGRGAKEGILIRNGEILENAGKIDTVVLDKTGTLTTGVFDVNEVITDMDMDTFLRLSASVENMSEHPIARTVVRYAVNNGVKLSEVESFESSNGGVKGVVNGDTVLLGTAAYLTKAGIEIPDVKNAGYTIFYIAVNNVFKGYITLGDKIREESKETIEKLHKMGVRTIMLSGDNEEVCKLVSEKTGINEYHANSTPSYKRQFITELKKSGAYVAMVGDGINDAAALAEANVGMAVQGGTDIAISSADITLTAGVEKLPTCIILSKKASVVIKQNLFWAFFYNILGIPVAAGVLYPFFRIVLNPMIAGTAMAFSSVTVVGNALRLKKVKLD